MNIDLSLKPKYLESKNDLHENLLKRWQYFLNHCQHAALEIKNCDASLLSLHHNNQAAEAIWTFFSLYLSAKEQTLKTETKTSIHALKPLQTASLTHIDDLDKQNENHPNWNQLATIKLNGGLGTSMGCAGPKSLIPVFKGETFLQLILKQQQHLNQRYQSKSPLFFMNSIFTQDACSKLISSSSSQTFLQNHFPRIPCDPLRPLHFKEKQTYFYPPGHGDIFSAFQQSGHLDRLVQNGVKYAFISNSDNLAAVPDPRILQHMIDKKIDFLMEVTPKTVLDIKGGALTLDNGRMRLLERADVPETELKLFEDISTFQLFNTNNLWVNLKTLQQKLKEGFSLPVILNQKKIEGQDLLQIETAMGSAIGLFEHSAALIVERDRFMPIKNTSDLFLLQSDLIIKDKNTGMITKNPLYSKMELPRISFPKAMLSMAGYEDHVHSIPSLLACDSLHIAEPCVIQSSMVCKGHVKI